MIWGVDPTRNAVEEVIIRADGGRFPASVSGYF